MKFIALVEESHNEFMKMIDLSKNHKSIYLDTTHCDEEHEYNNLLDNINKFIDSNFEIMIAKYSGRENITRDIGDEFSEMIVTFSSNKNSNYYIDNPIIIFEELLNLFE